jgi:hypothetical protein
MQDGTSGFQVEPVEEIGPEARLAVVEVLLRQQADHNVVVDAARVGVLGRPILVGRRCRADLPGTGAKKTFPRHGREGAHDSLRFHRRGVANLLSIPSSHSGQIFHSSLQDAIGVVSNTSGASLNSGGSALRLTHPTLVPRPPSSQLPQSPPARAPAGARPGGAPRASPSRPCGPTCGRAAGARPPSRAP